MGEFNVLDFLSGFGQVRKMREEDRVNKELAANPQFGELMRQMYGMALTPEQSRSMGAILQTGAQTAGLRGAEQRAANTALRLGGMTPEGSNAYMQAKRLPSLMEADKAQQEYYNAGAEHTRKSTGLLDKQQGLKETEGKVNLLQALSPFIQLEYTKPGTLQAFFDQLLPGFKLPSLPTNAGDKALLDDLEALRKKKAAASAPNVGTALTPDQVMKAQEAGFGDVVGAADPRTAARERLAQLVQQIAGQKTRVQDTNFHFPVGTWTAQPQQRFIDMPESAGRQVGQFNTLQQMEADKAKLEELLRLLNAGKIKMDELQAYLQGGK